MALVEVKVPDIGDFEDVAVIELLVQPGDTIKPEQSLATVESDKASMEIPSSHGGVIKELKIKLGDKVSEGSVIAEEARWCTPAGRSKIGLPAAGGMQDDSATPNERERSLTRRAIPATEATFTTRPQPFESRCGTTADATRKGAVRFTSTTRRHCTAGISQLALAGDSLYWRVRRSRGSFQSRGRV